MLAAEETGMGYVFTQRGMRRTFNDLARAAEVHDIVTRSISGHATERMQHHYSTVRGEEQEQGLGKVVNLIKRGLRRPHRHQVVIAVVTASPKVTMGFVAKGEARRLTESARAKVTLDVNLGKRDLRRF